MSATEKQRPVPTPTETTRPFWDAVNKRELTVQYDPVAGCYQFYPRAGSLTTGRRNLEWRPVSGKGSLYSYTVTHVPMTGFEERVPYILGLVDLDEGVRILANVINATEDGIEIGMRVRLAFEDLPDGGAYFCFEPDHPDR